MGDGCYHMFSLRDAFTNHEMYVHDLERSFMLLPHVSRLDISKTLTYLDLPTTKMSFFEASHDKAWLNLF